MLYSRTSLTIGGVRLETGDAEIFANSNFANFLVSQDLNCVAKCMSHARFRRAATRPTGCSLLHLNLTRKIYASTTDQRKGEGAKDEVGQD